LLTQFHGLAPTYLAGTLECDTGQVHAGNSPALRGEPVRIPALTAADVKGMAGGQIPGFSDQGPVGVTAPEATLLTILLVPELLVHVPSRLRHSARHFALPRAGGRDTRLYPGAGASGPDQRRQMDAEPQGEHRGREQGALQGLHQCGDLFRDRSAEPTSELQSRFDVVCRVVR